MGSTSLQGKRKVTGHGAFKRRGESRGIREARVKFPSDLAIGVRELVGTGGGGLSGNGIAQAVMDVPGPQARSE